MTTTRSDRAPSLPARRPRAARRPSAGSGTRARIAREARSLRGMTVLVVDDHEDTRVMFAEYLAWQGAHAIPVGGVREAIAVLEAIVVDVVLTDIGMPHEDGYALIARMDAHPKWIDIPRVIASGQSSPAEAHERGARAFHLSKPVALDELVRVVVMARGAGAFPATGTEARRAVAGWPRR